MYSHSRRIASVILALAPSPFESSLPASTISYCLPCLGYDSRWDTNHHLTMGRGEDVSIFTQKISNKNNADKKQLRQAQKKAHNGTLT